MGCMSPFSPPSPGCGVLAMHSVSHVGVGSSVGVSVGGVGVMVSVGSDVGVMVAGGCVGLGSGLCEHPYRSLYHARSER